VGASRRLHQGAEAKWQRKYRLRQAAGAGGFREPPPPIGPALGQQGVNIMEFCKQFNAQTQKQEKGLPFRLSSPCIRTAPSLHHETPPAAVLIRKRLAFEKAAYAQYQQGGKITRKQIEKWRRPRPPTDRRRPRGRGAHHCGQRPQHGRRSGGLLTCPP